MTAIVDVTSHTIGSVFAQPLVIVGWCVAGSPSWQAFCRIYDRIAVRYPQVVFASIDVEREASLAAACGICEVPLLMAFGHGRLCYVRAGFADETSLEAIARGLTQLAARSAVTPVAWKS